MATLLALYKHPKDTARFDAYYRQTHTPLAKTLPGLRSFRVSRGGVVAPSGASDYYQVATLTFDSLDELKASLASPEGQRTAGDLGNFADGGVELLIFDDQPA